jgi:hypothetical protein
MEFTMSHNERDHIEEEALQRTFQFDKFVEDIENREKLRRDAAERTENQINAANRLRDVRNRESLHNRVRWSR